MMLMKKTNAIHPQGSATTTPSPEILPITPYESKAEAAAKTAAAKTAGAAKLAASKTAEAAKIAKERIAEAKKAADEVEMPSEEVVILRSSLFECVFDLECIAEHDPRLAFLIHAELLEELGINFWSLGLCSLKPLSIELRLILWRVLFEDARFDSLACATALVACPSCICPCIRATSTATARADIACVVLRAVPVDSD